MELSTLLAGYVEAKQTQAQTAPRSERAEILEQFITRLNGERGTYKPLTAGFIASRMAQAGLKSNTDLYWFYKYCDDAQHFSKCWWWALKKQ